MRLYIRLAMSGIRRNRKLYYPYILTCVGMVMMFYILEALSELQTMAGHRTVLMVLGLGRFVIAVFAAIFLVYTNSFLIRRRNKEFGLYHVLGMGKGAIAQVMVWETLFVSLFSIATGIVLGLALTKFSELVLLNILHQEINYRLSVSLTGIWMTMGIFALIFLFLLCKDCWKVYRSDPLALLHSEDTGEKPPRSHLLTALLGVGLLAFAYYLAVSTQSPVQVIGILFIAVIMVIIATYLLFCAGSVTLCRLLQQRKKYYYQKNHFVSVSSMAFRMRRNGAGLASICILSTMVLVTICSTVSLYAGVEDTLNRNYPRDIFISFQLDGLDSLVSGEEEGILREGYTKTLAEYGAEAENVLDYRYVTLAGLLKAGRLEAGRGVSETTSLPDYDKVRQIYLISAEDYNAVMGTALMPSRGQAYLYTFRCEYEEDTLSVGDICLRVAGRLNEFPLMPDASVSVIPSLMLVVADYEVLRPLDMLAGKNGNVFSSFNWYYAYDVDAPDEVIAEIYRQRDGVFSLLSREDGYRYSSACRPLEKQSCYMLYGSLFFLGILLSIVFVFAAVLIIYYKQISEGYEDRSRYVIMRKVGMTREDIRKSVNSQILTVFFAPLLFAGLHLTFAFPLIWKILQLFKLYNFGLTVFVTVAAFLLFGVLYALVYKITAYAHYRIVSSDGKE